MGNKYTESQKKAISKYMETKHTIKVTVDKDKAEEYKRAAEKEGKSLSRFLADCAETEIDKMAQILTLDGREALEEGELTPKELEGMYKYELIRKASKIGSMQATFDANYKRVPDAVKELSPEIIASVVDALYDAYSEGKTK
ncbi:MAG: hypothetical protein MR945_09060 [Agathobacter sp.]|nr:hypothetical protein [Agathobacter sp.]